MEIYVVFQASGHYGDSIIKGYTFSEDTARQIVAKAEELKQMDFFEEGDETYYVPVRCLDSASD
jgi:hypothetical protein